jgi:hypothetical protein
MKRITFSLLIALVALASMNCVAKKSKATVAETPAAEQATSAAEEIPFEKLVDLIATSGHFDENKLVEELGLKQLISTEESFADEGDEGLEGAVEGDVSSMYYFVYAQNATAKLVEGEYGDELRLTSTGPHAYGIEVHLDTDNGTKLYFKEKADHDAFLQCLRKSSKYSTFEHSGGVNEYIGEGLLQDEEFLNDWYILDFHH